MSRLLTAAEREEYLNRPFIISMLDIGRRVWLHHYKTYEECEAAVVAYNEKYPFCDARVEINTRCVAPN
jgi:hypothetical protein